MNSYIAYLRKILKTVTIKTFPWLYPAWKAGKRGAAGKIALNRMAPAFGVALILFSLAISLPLNSWITAKKYRLNNDTLALIGSARPELSKKLVLNPQEAIYQFNPEAKKVNPGSSDDPNVVAQLLQKQQERKNVVGDSKDAGLYSLDLPVDASKGMTFTDNNANISFKMTPMFDKGAGRKTQDRLVYPLENGVKAIYTVKNNGLKEDIVYDAAPESGTAEYTYKLELPDSLEARLTDDGGMGIYSADPSLFGDISFGSDQDRVKVESARQNAPKDHLVFALPKPVIVAQGNKLGNSSAWFILGGSTLTVKATDLNTIKGPFSIDPSVVITSSSDFATGNDEGGIEFGADEIKRGKMTGGSTASFSATNPLPSTLTDHVSAYYNGYIYTMGGVLNGANSDAVHYAKIASNGNIEANSGCGVSWCATTSFTGARKWHMGTVYNGFLYVIGGYDQPNLRDWEDVQYAPINSNGSIGTWTPTNGIAPGIESSEAVTYNGHIYVTGGYSRNVGGDQSAVKYAAVNADGSLGVWSTTTSLPATIYDHGSAVANGYLYVTGGYSAAYINTVRFAAINPDGTIGTWSTTTNLPATLATHAAAVYNGYIYITGGDNGSVTVGSVYFAPIYSSGGIGAWATSLNLSSTRRSHTALISNDMMYVIGGASVSAVSNVDTAKINSAGTTQSYTATTGFPRIQSGGKRGGKSQSCTFAANGYLHVIGGRAYTIAVGVESYYAVINADGSVGTWSTSTNLPANRYAMGCAVHNNYVYLVGGAGLSAPVTTVMYGQINGTGGVSTWNTISNLPTARESLTSVVHNGYLYAIGGLNGTTYYDSVLYAKLAANGSMEVNSGCGVTWCTTTALPSVRAKHASVVSGGHIYIAAGTTDGSTNLNTVIYAPIASDGSLVSTLTTCPSGSAPSGGSWCTASSFNTARSLPALSTYNGYLYLSGGIGAAYYNDMQYSAINSNNSIGLWATNIAYATVRAGHGAVVNQGRLYIVGGHENTIDDVGTLSDVQYAQINNGGLGTSGTYTPTTTLTTARRGHASVVNGGYLYIIGGNNGVYLSDVEYAPFNSDGTLGTFVPASGLNSARGYFDAVVYNGYIYAVGGRTNGGAYLSDVEFAAINLDGTIGSFAGTTGFTDGRNGHASVTHNGYLYVIGGSNGTYFADVQYAPINANGTLGAFTATTSFTTARSSHTALIAGGYLYVMGGFNGTYFADVQYAPINANGTLGAFTATTSFTTARSSHTTVTHNGYLYIIGGSNGTYLSDVQYATINANGTLGAFTATTSFTTARSTHESLVHRGNLYVIGGYNLTSTYLPGVQFAQLNSILRTAQYSKLIDIGSLVTVSNIGYTGTLPGAKSSIAFRYAGLDGIFSPSAPAYTLGGTCGTSVSARYILITMNLDDTATGVFADSSGTAASIQDITVDSISGGGGNAVDPSKRLRGGKYFDDITGLQPLDTLKLAASGGEC